MNDSKRRAAVRVISRTPAALLGFVALLGCADPQVAARDRALSFFREQIDVAETSWSYLLPFFARQYRVSVELASGVQFRRDSQVPLESYETLDPFRRLFDPGESVAWPTVQALESPVDRMMAAALHCDRNGVPPTWNTILGDATVLGGYALTHAVLATEWTLENRCRSAIDLAPLRARQRVALEALLDDPESLVSRDAARDADIWTEALALLVWIGGAESMEPRWMEAMLAAQRPDGGFSESSVPGTSSSAHTTAFALWVLLQSDESNPGRMPMIPR